MEPIREDGELLTSEKSLYTGDRGQAPPKSRGSRHLAAEEEDIAEDFDWALGYGSAPYAIMNVSIQAADLITAEMWDEVNPLRVVANCLILVWVINFLWNYIEISRWRTTGGGVLLVYLILNTTFFAVEGFTNDAGSSRTFVWACIMTTLAASTITQLSLREIRLSDPVAERDELIL
jgi:hypothetical protein